ncbi:PREDICTED: F-box/kelch-repeat protein At3g23880-like [Ipomoea nil]|uniref:F-box/kelch-repeat protein At3g23880-like n=1 Tax=Ipomoea nil TaxID=35883 RepID=UPI000901A04E|nr:PREDICTED: F-box/kelch-repeat protein At3g23880-like [Ipomoea nil]
MLITYDCSPLVPRGGFEFSGSWNGLFCFRAKSKKIINYNPSSNVNLKNIPDVWQLGYNSIFAFGYDEHNDDYKAVYAYYADYSDENMVLVYSLKYGTWKRRKRGFISGFVNPITVVFVSGNLNWCNNNLDDSDWNWNIISYNLTTQTAKSIMLSIHEHGAAFFISGSR